ncbi:MAG: ABC transporter substrate-binding protein [Dehalococcoidia bacterium]|nr:ABC transporter substrate-binding protein [Dehalococcoidia bacterium]
MGQYRLSISLVLAVIFLAVSACSTPVAQPPAEEKVLKVGSVMPFSGPASFWGLAERPVMEIYADLINEDGGLKIGDDMYRVEMYFADGPMDPAADAAAARSLIYDKNVKAILGYFGVGYYAVSAVTVPEKIILDCTTISMGAYDAKKDPYSIFGFPAVEMSINQALAVMQAFPGAKTLCWVYASGGNVDVEKIYTPVDEAIEETYGVKSVRVAYPAGTLNFTAYIAKMAELGADVLYMYGQPLEVGLLAKQRYQMGYTWPIASNAALLDIKTVKGIAGSEEAMQNICGDYCLPWELKKVTVAPKYLDMAIRIRDTFEAKYPDKELYAGAFGTGVPAMGHYFEAVQMAGTTDPDEVMGVLRGGTLETFLGRYTLSGAETYGSPVVFGFPCAMSIIKGNEIIYLNEEPLWDVDHPVGGVEMYKPITK